VIRLLVSIELVDSSEILHDGTVAGTVAVVGCEHQPVPFVGLVQLLGLLETIAANDAARSEE
jgi:hypothetical protein